jgi:hypothetical protein
MTNHSFTASRVDGHSKSLRDLSLGVFAPSRRKFPRGASSPHEHRGPLRHVTTFPHSAARRNTDIVNGYPAVMRLSSPVVRRVARVSLCFAAMLYFIGATAGSALHVHLGDRASSSATWQAQKDGAPKDSEPTKRAPHDELSCFLCKALSSPGLPPAGSTTEFVASLGFVPAPDPDQVLSALRSASPKARAPPVA